MNASIHLNPSTGRDSMLYVIGYVYTWNYEERWLLNLEWSEQFQSTGLGKGYRVRVKMRMMFCDGSEPGEAGEAGQHGGRCF